MIELIKNSKKSLHAGLILGLLMACQFKKSSEQDTQSLSVATTQNVQLQTLKGRLQGDTQGLRGLLITNSPANDSSALSQAFFISAKTQDTVPADGEILGLVAEQSFQTGTFIALHSDGRRSSCVSSSNTPVSPSQQSILLRCEHGNVQLTLSWQPTATPAVDHHNAITRLEHGATLKLTSDVAGTIETQLQSERLIIHKNNQTNHFRISSTVSETQGNGREIRLNGAADGFCQPTPCNPLSTSAELALSSAGLQIQLKDSLGQIQETFRSAVEKTLTIASYNVENFWDDKPDNSSPYSDFSNMYSNWYIENFAQKKVERIKKALLAAGLPDVVGLQEIESANNQGRSLELLKPALAELGYNHYALGKQAEDNPTAVTTAVISRFPILLNTHIDFLFAPAELSADEQKNFVNSSRDPQHVNIATPEGTVFALINSHWKSKRDKSPWGDAMRQAVAKSIKLYSDSLTFTNGAPVPVVLTGDFNADYREAPIQSGLELAATLAAARVAGNPKLLVPLWLTRNAKEQGSYPHDSHLQALDNIAVTASFLQRGELKLSQPLAVVGSSGLAASLLANADGQPLRSQLVKYKDSQGDIHSKHFDIGFSDHFPLVAHFERTSSGSAQMFASEIEKQNSGNLPLVTISGFECLASETVSLSPEMLADAPHGQCVRLSDVSLTLNKTGLYNIYIESPSGRFAERSRKIIVTTDRAYGANKSWLRGTLQNSAGRTLTKVRGKIGLVDGQKAIFIHSPLDDIEIK